MMRNHTGWLRYDDPSLHTLHRQREALKQERQGLSWITDEDRIWQIDRELESVSQGVIESMRYQYWMTVQLQRADLYRHGWICLPDHQSLRTYDARIHMDENMLMIILRTSRPWQHWFIEYNPNFTMRLKRGGYGSRLGTGYSVDDEKIWTGMDAVQAMWNYWLQYQHCGYTFCLDVLSLYTHNDHIKWIPEGWGYGNITYDFYVEAR